MEVVNQIEVETVEEEIPSGGRIPIRKYEQHGQFAAHQKRFLPHRLGEKKAKVLFFSDIHRFAVTAEGRYLNSMEFSETIVVP